MTCPDGWVVGIDLAWGDAQPDGLCFLRIQGGTASVSSFAYPQGDDALFTTLRQQISRRERAFLAIDAPIVCPNPTGSRPVDRLTHTLFHRQHAACHPANQNLCPRPPRILRGLRAEGFFPGWNVTRAKRLACEVYPHPAMVRWFHLDRILKYKRGPVAVRRTEFARLGRLTRSLLQTDFPELIVGPEIRSALRAPWSKPAEDRLDSFFCALIGLWHLKHAGRLSQVLGDLHTGFILLPNPPPSPCPRPARTLDRAPRRAAR
ncbi:MAG: DUF429 domain-containing protein [Verrucomicrobiia bacterium]